MFKVLHSNLRELNHLGSRFGLFGRRTVLTDRRRFPTNLKIKIFTSEPLLFTHLLLMCVHALISAGKPGTVCKLMLHGASIAKRCRRTSTLKTINI